MTRVLALLSVLISTLGCRSAAGAKPLSLYQDQVVVYEGENFTGRSWTPREIWTGSPEWDRRIRSIRVPKGFKVTLYSEPYFSVTQSNLLEDWSTRPGNAWIGRIRSFRIHRTSPSPTSSYPVIYSQSDFHGPAMAIERDFASLPDWDGSPHHIRSIRVPAGWMVTIYEHPNYRGRSENLT